MKPFKKPFSFLIIFCIAAAVQAQNQSLQDFDWFVGCWQGETASGQYSENWMRPSGNMMMGMSRTLKDGKQVHNEFLQLVKKTDGIYYVARPSFQPEAAFKLVKTGTRQAIFENPQHDYPQRIIYRMDSNDSLFARIEGKIDGKDQASDYPMKRVRCDAGSSPW